MSVRHLTYGATFIVLFALTVALTFAMYKDEFSSKVPVTLMSDRAGLTMDVGAVVKLRGVEIGRVNKVKSDGEGARLELQIDSKYQKLVPSNVSAQIIPPTAFGAKYVQLTMPTRAADPAIKANGVIGANHVTVEVNDAFENLMGILDAAHPVEFNNALTSLAQAVDGRGEELGQLITKIDTYLASFNPQLPTLSADIKKSVTVLDAYAKLTPDLIKLGGNLSTTSDTLVDRRASLDAFILSLTKVSDKTGKFVDDNGKQLTTTLKVLDPVQKVLARYSPELPCTLEGLVLDNGFSEKSIGGVKPGVNTVTRLQPSDDPYTNPNNLPKVSENSGPHCFGLPTVSKAEGEKPNPVFDVGASPNSGPPNTAAEDLATTFFGVLAGLVNLG